VKDLDLGLEVETGVGTSVNWVEGIGEQTVCDLDLLGVSPGFFVVMGLEGFGGSVGRDGFLVCPLDFDVLGIGGEPGGEVGGDEVGEVGDSVVCFFGKIVDKDDEVEEVGLEGILLDGF